MGFNAMHQHPNKSSVKMKVEHAQQPGCPQPLVITGMQGVQENYGPEQRIVPCGDTLPVITSRPRTARNATALKQTQKKEWKTKVASAGIEPAS